MVVFDPVERIILILEDDSFYQNILSQHAKLAARFLKSDNLFVELKILRAESLQEALNILKELEGKIDILSVDVNLDDKNITNTSLDALDGTIGGFGVLEKFKEKSNTLSIVVSGQEQVDYPMQAYQEYGVLNYINKGSHEKDDIYIASLQVALWYLTAHDAISFSFEDLELRDLERAKVAWEKTLEVAQKAKIRPNYLPQNIGERIEKLETEFIHPLTGFPVGEWSYAKLRRFIIKSQQWSEQDQTPELSDWAILRCRLEGFGKLIGDFNSQKPALLRMFSNAVTLVSQQYHTDIVFVGQLDRDLVQGEPQVFFIFNDNKRNTIKKISQQMEKDLLQDVTKVLPSNLLNKDLKAEDYPISIQFKTWFSDENHDFSDLHVTLDKLNRGGDD